MTEAVKRGLEEHWIDSRLELRSSIIQGKGVFTKEFIGKDETIMIWGGKLFTMEDVRKGKAKQDSLSGYKEGLFLGQPIYNEDTLDQFLNHSCAPNLWMLDEVTIAAMRDINANEEVTIDYALFELDDKWKLPIPCNCGSSKCRGNITGLDWQIESLQRKYNGHFLPYINDRIKHTRIGNHIGNSY